MRASDVGLCCSSIPSSVSFTRVLRTLNAGCGLVTCRWLLAGRRHLAGLNNELFHGVGPIAANWNGVSYDRYRRSVHLKWDTCGPIIYLHCGGVTVRSCRSFVDRLSSERARRSRSCQQLWYQRRMNIPISCEFRWPNGSIDWLCKVGKLSGTPYICPCGWRFDMKPIMPDVVIERKAPSAF